MNIADIRKKAKAAKAEAESSDRTAMPAVSGNGEILTDAGFCHPGQTGSVIPSVVSSSPGISDVERLENLFAEIADLDNEGEGGVAGADRQDQVKRRYLAFRLDREEYALPIEAVKEIIKPREITEIPRVPAFLLGIISLRGTIIPIIDLRARLKLGNASTSEESRIVVCQNNDQQAGFLVDCITQVVAIGDDAIEPPPLVLSGIDRAFVDGIGRGQDSMLILMNLPGVLTLDWE